MISCIDIETGPASPEALAKVMPDFKAPANYKDQAKIDAYLNEAESAWVEQAALSAITGQILAIGVLRGAVLDTMSDGGEQAMLSRFWTYWAEPGRIVGFAIKGFDLPYLFRRSLIHKVTVPTDLFNGRFWNGKVVDLQEIWACYNRQDMAGHSLDAVCACLGLGRKNGNGADFAKLFHTDKPAAMLYLKRDLELTAALAERLGVA